MGNHSADVHLSRLQEHLDNVITNPQHPFDTNLIESVSHESFQSM